MLLDVGCWFDWSGCAAEKNAIQPHGDDVDGDQHWNQHQPLILEFVGQSLNTEDCKVSGDQSENESADAGRVHGLLCLLIRNGSGSGGLTSQHVACCLGNQL